LQVWLSVSILCLIIISPSIAMVVSLPRGESFSELWLLGEGHMIEDYPHDVRENEIYRVYLGVGNHMGGLESYLVHVKFRNSSEPLPDTFYRTASPLPSLLEYRFFLCNNGTWEREVSFAFSGVSINGNVSRVENMVIDDEVFSINKTVAWSEEPGGFYYQLFFELLRFNLTRSNYEFHDRFVGLRLNMTIF